MLFVSLCACLCVFQKFSWHLTNGKKCIFYSAKLDKPCVSECVCQCILKFPTAIGLRPSTSFCGKVNRCYVCGLKETQITFTWTSEINLIFFRHFVWELGTVEGETISRLNKKRTGTKMKVDSKKEGHQTLTWIQFCSSWPNEIIY